MLTVNSTSTVLHLDENDLGDEDATKLADSIARNFAFKELYLKKQWHWSSGWQQAGRDAHRQLNDEGPGPYADNRRGTT
jgi:hypothetical protein